MSDLSPNGWVAAVLSTALASGVVDVKEVDQIRSVELDGDRELHAQLLAGCHQRRSACTSKVGKIIVVVPELRGWASKGLQS